MVRAAATRQRRATARRASPLTRLSSARGLTLAAAIAMAVAGAAAVLGPLLPTAHAGDKGPPPESLVGDVSCPCFCSRRLDERSGGYWMHHYGPGPVNGVPTCGTRCIDPGTGDAAHDLLLHCGEVVNYRFCGVKLNDTVVRSDESAYLTRLDSESAPSSAGLCALVRSVCGGFRCGSSLCSAAADVVCCTVCAAPRTTAHRSPLTRRFSVRATDDARDCGMSSVYASDDPEDDCSNNVKLSGCFVAFPRCDIDTDEALGVCQSTCVNEAMSCRELNSDFGPRETIEGLCSGDGFEEEAGPSLLCTGAAGGLRPAAAMTMAAAILACVSVAVLAGGCGTTQDTMAAARVPARAR